MDTRDLFEDPTGTGRNFSMFSPIPLPSVSSCHPYSSLDHATMLVCGGHVTCASMYAHRGHSANHVCAAAWLSQLLSINR